MQDMHHIVTNAVLLLPTWVEMLTDEMLYMIEDDHGNNLVLDAIILVTANEDDEYDFFKIPKEPVSNMYVVPIAVLTRVGNYAIILCDNKLDKHVAYDESFDFFIKHHMDYWALPYLYSS